MPHKLTSMLSGKKKIDGMLSVVIADTLPFSMVINHIERLGKSGSNPFDKENSLLTFFLKNKIT
jgi:hypothetical protein